MNLAKLVFGWVFLAGFTAAGTYYAMDEVDHRIGLARFQLHERLGIVRYQVNPNPVNPNPVNPNPVNPNPVNPNPVNPNPVNPNPVNPNPNPVNPNPVNPNPVNPNPVNPNPVNPNPVNPNPVNPNPGPVTPPPHQNPNPVNPNPINPNPVNPNPVNPNPGPVNPPRPNPSQNPPPSRPADFTDTDIRLTQLNGQLRSFRDSVGRIRAQAPNGTARLDGPMSNLESFLRQARNALGNNDTTTANRLMNAADGEVAKLKELLDQ